MQIYGGFGNVRVTDQNLFYFTRVDVGPARDDHVDLAVREVQIALFVEVADVAQGEDTRLEVRVTVRAGPGRRSSSWPARSPGSTR